MPRRLSSDPVDGSHEETVGHRVRGLLQLPEVFGHTGDSRRWVEDDPRAMEAENPRSLGEVAVVTDVDADRPDRGLKNGIAEVAGLEVKLLIETRVHVGDVVFTVEAEQLTVRVNHRGGVVVHACHSELVNGDDDHHAVLFRDLLHALHGRAGDRLGEVVPARVVLGAEIGAIEKFLITEYLDTVPGCFLGERDVLLEHGLLDLFQFPRDIRMAHLRCVCGGWDNVGSLYEPSPDSGRHILCPPLAPARLLSGLPQSGQYFTTAGTTCKENM